MTVLLILGIIVLLLLLLLCLPVGVEAAFCEGQLTARLRYAFVTYPLYPAKPKKPKAEKPPKKQPKEKPKEAAEPKKKKSLSETAHEVLALLKCSRGGIRILRRHLIFSRVRVAMRAASEDAHQTAMLYARLYNITALSLSIIDELFVLKPPQIDIRPDFLASSTRYDLALRVSIRPIFVLAAALSVLIAYLRLPKQRKPNHPPVNHPPDPWRCKDKSPYHREEAGLNRSGTGRTTS